MQVLWFFLWRAVLAGIGRGVSRGLVYGAVLGAVLPKALIRAGDDTWRTGDSLFGPPTAAVFGAVVGGLLGLVLGIIDGLLLWLLTLRFFSRPHPDPRRYPGVAIRACVATTAGIGALAALVWLAPGAVEADSRHSFVQSIIIATLEVVVPLLLILYNVGRVVRNLSGTYLAVLADRGGGLPGQATR